MTLPNGATVGVEAADGADLGAEGVPNFDDVKDVVEGIVQGLRAAIEKTSPDKFTVEFALAVKAEAGTLTKLIAKGEAGATLTFTAEWDKNE